MSVCTIEEGQQRSDATASRQRLEAPSDYEAAAESSDVEKEDGNSISPSISMETTRALAVQALALTVQEWHTMGQGKDPSVSDAALFDAENALDLCVQRVTALLLVRIVAIQFISNDGRSDISTSGICRQALIAEEPPWPCITEQILKRLQRYVRSTLQEYSATLPFHNFQHAVTVVVNCNKLLDLMLAENHETAQFDGRRPPTFGLRTDPLLLAALLFAALVHDVQHQGVRNSQLVMENHPAALLYNDQSVQEKQALQVAFTEFLKPDYEALRVAMFNSDDAAYRYFRVTVVSAVMSTDLASPEQTVVTKSKWKEAFGQQQMQEQLLHKQFRRGSLVSNISMPRAFSQGRFNRRGSNCSDLSDVTTDMNSIYGPASPLHSPRRVQGEAAQFSHHRRLSLDNPHRRMSGDNSCSRRRMSGDSNYGRRRMSGDAAASERRRRQQRRLSYKSEESLDGESNEFAADSVAMLIASKTVPRAIAAANDTSIGSVASDTMDSFKAGLKKHKQKQRAGTPRSVDFALGEKFERDVDDESEAPHLQKIGRTPSSDTNESGEASLSFVSLAAESIGITQKRLDGAKMTRSRANKPTGDILIIDKSNHSGSYPSSPRGHQEDLALAQSCNGEDVNIYHHIDVDYDESSFSLTPPSSEDEHDGPAVPTAVSPPPNLQTRTADRPTRLTDNLVSPRTVKHVTRRASTGMVSSRFGSLADQRIDEDRPNNASYRNFRSKSFDLDLQEESGHTVDSSRFRKRLGIRRSMDLSGESIEIYSKRSSLGAMSALSSAQIDDSYNTDEPDYLRASAVLETMLRAADVGHFLQSWPNMTNWSYLMFLELTKANREGRGPDPGSDWFDNQIRIMDSYLKPLALQLDDSGVFGEFVGAIFAQNVDEIRNHWLVYGYEWTETLRLEAAVKFPAKDGSAE